MKEIVHVKYPKIQVTADNPAYDLKLLLYIMKSDMTHSFQLVLEILDLETCLMEMTEVQRRFPLLCARIILSKRLAAEYAAARLGATVMDIQKSLTEALDEDIKLVK